MFLRPIRQCRSILQPLHSDIYKKCVGTRNNSSDEHSSSESSGEIKADKTLNVAEGEVMKSDEKSKEVQEKHYLKFESRLDAFRKSDFVSKPQYRNVQAVLESNPIVDKAISFVQGKPDSLLVPHEIYTENSDNRSITTYPPENHTQPQMLHEEVLEETTLGRLH